MIDLAAARAQQSEPVAWFPRVWWAFLLGGGLLVLVAWLMHFSRLSGLAVSTGGAAIVLGLVALFYRLRRSGK